MRRDSRDRQLACRVNVEQNHLVGHRERFGKLGRKVAGAAIQVRLEDNRELAAGIERAYRTDAGFQRQQSDTGSFSPAYKYQEDNLRRGFKAKGFNWLDRILDFLTANIERYEEFRKSDAYEDRVSAIVRSTKDVDDVYFINSSRLVFLRLKVHIGFVEEMTLRPEIGENLYKTLKDGLKEGTADEKIERLRVACSKYVAALAVMRLLKQTGSITDRGLYFTSLLSGKEGNMEVKPVDDNRLRLELDGLKEVADAYRVSLMRLIRNEWSDMYAGDAGRVMDMDNDGRKIFWA